MPAPTRIYLVTAPDGSSILVRALTPAQAIRHAARGYKACVASQDHLLWLLSEGAKVETAGDNEAAS